MAAPQIPNLLTLMGSGGGRRGGSRSTPLRATAEPDTPPPEQTKQQNDIIVQATDTDANLSRLSAVAAGYLRDEFANEFRPAGDVPRRYPIINRGTYARTSAVDRLVDAFLSSQPRGPRQVVSLGAGSDTRYFRLMQAAIGSSGGPPNFVYHEIDFAVNTAKKVATIRASPRLRSLVGDSLPGRPSDGCSPAASATASADELHSPYYHLHARDLRDLYVPAAELAAAGTASPAHRSRSATPTAGRSSSAASSPARRPLSAAWGLPYLDPAVPTMLVSECCLTYLAPDAADGVVRFFAQAALAPRTPVGIALYEPIQPFDAFGRTMVSNLARRGIVLQTIRKYHSLEAQRARLKAYGLVDGARAVDVDFLLQEWIDEDESRRVSRVEMLDEVEELNLLAKHYCVAWAWRNGGERRIWDKWRTLPEREE